MKSLATKLAALALLGLTLNTHAGFIYNNANPSSDLVQRLQASEGIWFGDEVTLAGVDRFLVGFDFQFWAESTTGLTVDVQLLRNDGPLSAGYASPQTVIYSSLISAPLGISLPVTSRATLNFDSTDLGGGIDISGVNNLTLAVRFNNIGSGSAGVDLYYPSDVGSSYPDYWQVVGGNWQLTTNNTFSVVNFAMRIEAVPEPSSFALLLFGGLAAVAGGRLVRRRS